MDKKEKMNQLKRNLVANFMGKGWSALMSLAFIPLYIRFMGIETFGLVGFFSTLQGTFAFLDLGLSTTINRELARCSASPEKSGEMPGLVRTLETVSWGIGVLVAVAVMSLSSLIAQNWVKPETVSLNIVRQAVILMGLAMAFQWPFSLYSSGLLGLQRQVLYNGLNAICYTLRFAGAAAVLWLIAPSVQVFFAWQVFVSILSSIFAAFTLWRALPARDHPPHFQVTSLRSIWRFAGGMSAISVTVLLLTQLDKIILSKLLSLEMFGYYTLAWAVAYGLANLINPIFTTVFPAFSRWAAINNIEGLKRFYHSSCQLMSVVILPAAMVIVFFAREILLIWTGNPAMVENTYVLVTLLVIGTALNGLMNLPYALQLAHGWTSLAFFTNLISVIILTPVIIIMATHYGPIGGAVAWTLLNVGYVLIQVQIMHRRLLKGQQWIWYRRDVGAPLAAALIPVVIGRWLLPGELTGWATLLYIMAVWSIATVAAGVAVPGLRAHFSRMITTTLLRSDPAG